MKTAIESSLLLSIAAGLAYFFLPTVKKWSGRIFLAALTVFVAVTLGSAQHDIKEIPGPMLDLDQAELSLKMLSAFRTTQGRHSVVKLHTAISAMQYDGAPISQMLVSRVYSQVISSLERRLPKQAATKQGSLKSRDFRTLAEIAIVCGESGDVLLRPKLLEDSLQLLSSSKPEFRDLGKTISSIYSGQRVSPQQALRSEKVLQSNLPSGWYRNQALKQLLKVSGQYTAYEKLKASTDTAALAFARRTVVLLMFMSIATLVGIITILIFLATERRQVVDTAPINAPWSLTTTYGVLVGWLATQLIAQSLIAGCAKQQLKHLLLAGSVTTAMTSLVIYMITTGPALLYIWWFACRPFNLRFVDAIRLRLKTATSGTFKLASFGVLTWCAAIPVVLGSHLLALKLFSSQGSNNPMLSLVRDAAQSPSILPVVIYFLILGVVAPLVEETLFRGFVYSSLRTKLGKFAAAGISAAGFAAVHLDPGAFISLFALGFLFALVCERYQSILPSVVAHGMWNCGTFTLVLVLLGGS